ncbi:hypothetical protein ACW7G0_11295 [Lysobacter sp. A286]
MGEPNFHTYSENTWDTVDHKVAEAEFFLARLFNSSGFDFNCYFSAYLSASRTVTLAIQHFNHVPGLKDWYEQHRSRLKTDVLSRTFLELRNKHVHGGMYPISGAIYYQNKSVKFLRDKESGLTIDDLSTAAREHFLTLLEIAYDAYVALGLHIDPQQHYTREHYVAIGGGIENAELEIFGWVCDHLIEEGFDEDDRWHELRGNLDECQINHLFYAYLGKTTPAPKLPDYLEEIEPSVADRGWNHVPAGYTSADEYWIENPSRKPESPSNQ